MENIIWQGNSRKMYEAILAQTPAVFRVVVKNRINGWLSENKITVVTEELVFKAVDDIAPSDLAKTIKPELEKLRG